MKARPTDLLAPTPARGAVRVATPGDAQEREAQRLAATGTTAREPAAPLPRVPASAGWTAGGTTRLDRAPDGAALASGLQPLASGAGEALPAPTQQRMAARLGHDFANVRLHRGTEASRSATALGAAAYTSGSQIVLGTEGQAMRGPALERLLTHELAHVVQQSRAGAAPLIQRQPTSLGGIPQAERRSIRAGTIPVTVPPERIAAFFTIMPSGRPSETRSVGATNSFGAGIGAALQGGLASIAAYIAGDTNGLPRNSSIEVDLDLSAHGGAATTYRFTYFAHTTGSGRSASTSDMMLIEQVGAVRARPAAVTAPSGAFSVGSTGYTLAGSWTDGDYTLLREALTLLPAAATTAAAGLTFRRVGGSTGPEAGRYRSGSDTVEINDLAFPAATNLRFGQRPPAVRTLLHEIGHAIDLRVLERAWQAYNSAGQTAAARRTLLAVRSPSGSRWGRAADGSGNDEIQQNAADAAPAFRAAVARDGVRRDTSGSRTTPEGTTATLSGGITTYSETDYQELYAESFAMYVAARETLRQLRPATFAYFAAQFP